MYHERGPSIERLNAELSDALRRNADADEVASFVTQILAASVQAATGECRLDHDDGKYAGVRPVLGKAGVTFCCTGKPTHCSDVVVGRGQP